MPGWRSKRTDFLAYLQTGSAMVLMELKEAREGGAVINDGRGACSVELNAVAQSDPRVGQGKPNLNDISPRQMSNIWP